MKFQKSELLYEGKGKRVFKVVNSSAGGQSEENLLWLEFKDSLTAFNAKKKGSFANKGAINRDIASAIFRHLKKSGIQSHWIEDIGAAEMLCEKLTMIPLEVVVRNGVAGSFAQKFALAEGAELSPPVVEFFYKKDELNDPFINDDQALYLRAAKDQAELETLKSKGLAINSQLREFFARLGLRLIDFKLEFGRSASGEIRLGDEITPDSCRLWDVKTNEKMDKDRFRRDLGNVAEGYQEVLERVRRVWGQ